MKSHTQTNGVNEVSDDRDKTGKCYYVEKIIGLKM